MLPAPPWVPSAVCRLALSSPTHQRHAPSRSRPQELGGAVKAGLDKQLSGAVAAGVAKPLQDAVRAAFTKQVRAQRCKIGRFVGGNENNSTNSSCA